MTRPILLRLAACAAAYLCATLFAYGDEGMWVFDKLPLRELKARYGFEPTASWIEHLRSSAVRFNSGGSGSFVSSDGLVLTNHHVGSDTLNKISSAKKNYYRDGFYAKTRAEEVKAPDLELNVLVAIEDVTDKVKGAVKLGMSDEDAGKAKRAAIAVIEKESLDKSGLRSDVVTLYQGGKYALYTYKKYTDVRLVFAPEFAIAFFGGDPDNFEYPRYDLDFCLFRAYENDQPVRPKHFLKWSEAGAKEGDLTFVAGHPGRTSRLNTSAHLEFLRDVQFPLVLEVLRDREKFLLAYGERGPEQDRQSHQMLFGYQNSRKARDGGQKGLNNAAVMARKAAREKEIRAKIDADPRMRAAYAAAWDKIAAALKLSKESIHESMVLERGMAFDSRLFQIARTLVRMAEETAKPNSDRLAEYRDSSLESTKLALFSAAPIYPEFEIARLAHSLEYWVKKVGADNPTVKKVLAGKTPAERAKELVEGSKLDTVTCRHKVAESGASGIKSEPDAMIQLALLVDPEARAVRKKTEREVEDVLEEQYGLIAKALFELEGDNVYPDATFTLRLAFGPIAGYEVDGKKIPAFTTMGGAFEHAASHGDKPPYELPASWIEAKKAGRLKLDTPFNFVSTADIIGGNSGSPVVNRDNELVGLIFDGNIESLVLDFAYDDVVSRAVSVDTRSILESLRSIYSAEGLLDELLGKK
ncbi:MAG: S46 family peptidase [Planctomycetota bacterium]|nr:S46 family peptidase [Planctomycetota bacterium]